MSDKYLKMFTLANNGGHLTGEAIADLKNAEKIHGEPMRLMRRWLLAGKLMDGLGHGLLDTLVAMAESGQFSSMGAQQKAEIVKGLIDRNVWLSAPVPQVTPASDTRLPDNPPTPDPIKGPRKPFDLTS